MMLHTQTRWAGLVSIAVLSTLLGGCDKAATPEVAPETTPETTATESVGPSAAVATDTPPTAAQAPLEQIAAATNLVEGRDYTVIKSPLTLEKPGQIEVREFFWYGCGHCYALEPHLNNWLATKPTDVNFIRTPAALNPVWEQNARAYYAVEGMGKMSDALHEQLFTTIHQKQQQIFDQPSLTKFYSAAGIDAAQFNSAYNSFAVSTKINQSKKMAQQAGLSGVPALVVNGQYLVGGEPQRVIAIVKGLIEQAQQAQAAPTR